MDAQLTFFETFDQADLERCAAKLKKAGWHVYPRGRVQRLSVTRSFDAYLIEQMNHSHERNRFMDYIERAAAAEMGHELARGGCILKTPTVLSRDYRCEVAFTVEVVRPQ